MPEPDRPQSWWQSLPGILTATATVLTALSGLLVVLYQNGALRSAPSPSSPTSAEMVVSAGDSAPEQPPTPAGFLSAVSDQRTAMEPPPEKARDSSNKA